MEEGSGGLARLQLGQLKPQLPTRRQPLSSKGAQGPRQAPLTGRRALEQRNGLLEAAQVEEGEPLVEVAEVRLPRRPLQDVLRWVRGIR